jgi:hypothetical protein
MLCALCSKYPLYVLPRPPVGASVFFEGKKTRFCLLFLHLVGMFFVCSYLGGQWISGSVVEGAPTEEPRPDASNARSQQPAPEGNWCVSCSCLCVKHPPVVAHRRFALPRSSILCGCINIPGRQVNAVWGRCPTECTMCVKKKRRVQSVCLGALRQNLSRLRVEKLGCAVPVVARSSQLLSCVLLRV